MQRRGGKVGEARNGARDRRIVDQRLQPAEAVDGVESSQDGCFLGEVSLDGERSAAGALDGANYGRRGVLVLAEKQGDRKAARGGQARRGGADPAASPGDETDALQADCALRVSKPDTVLSG